MSDKNSRTSPRRILNILEEILSDPDNFTAKRISHKLDIPLATVYRHIDTLCDERFLIANNSKKYIPGPKIRNIILHSLPYEPNFTLRRSYLRKLTADIKETVSPFSAISHDFPQSLKSLSQNYEVELIKSALAHCQYNQKKTAQALELTYHQLRGYLKKYNLLEGSTADELS